MEIVNAADANLSAMVSLFVARVAELRAAVPLVPDTLAQPKAVAQRLGGLIADAPGWVALDGGSVVGYLCGWIVPDFRGAGRTTAYCPEWGHAAVPGREEAVYRALYRAAARAWYERGCEAHALTMLTPQLATERVWFWNGFGGLVVDAVRGMEPLAAAPPPARYTLKCAGISDLEAVLALETEHARHYPEPPTLMCAYGGSDRDELAALLAGDAETVWLALDGAEPAAFLRVGREHRGSDLLSGPGAAAICGAYTRPAHRGQRLMPALINAALAAYAQEGAQRCTVDFESVNLEAAVFWPRYFTPVCLSVRRVPERGPAH
jgi:ribosomal protein S18 acetylase RimI-like enzyme